ncbi:MAG: Zn-dependent hydrolase [Beijerinckiaceae bacterium]
MKHGNLRIDGARLMSRLMALAHIGATPDGGCRRLALTDEDKQGRDWLVEEMRALGLTVQIDAIGNIVGVLKGAHAGPALIMGSHIDTVATGGKYDGAYGVIAGLEVLAALRDAQITPPRDMAVIAFTNEEGARFQPDMFGSCVWAGQLSLADARNACDTEGLRVGDELRRIGYEGSEPPGFLAAHSYLELHIEQGPVLDREGGGIGAVTGVQGITWLELTIEGQPNHAGTTPMAYRRDAGLAAARINAHAHEVTKAIPGQLANMGFIRFDPNNVNVVPERVVATLDLRNPDAAGLAEAENNVRDFCKRCADEGGVTIDIRDLARFAPTPFSESLIASVEHAAHALNYPVRRMISGAGHDAQLMASLCPTAMIFVPSTGGLSHNPKEFTAEADLIAGANVLLQAAMQAAHQP